MKKALVIGAQGTIGAAIVDHLQGRYEVHALSRNKTDFSEEGLKDAATALQLKLDDPSPFELIICTIGFLSKPGVSPEKKLADLDAQSLMAPEKKLADLDAQSLMEYFSVNAVIPALCLKYFSPMLKRDSKSCFAVLSAMVGSIQDNKLGGWYGYRSSKAALNMLIKTASIELKRTNKVSVVVAIHPGTTIGPLTQPFSKNIDKSKYYDLDSTIFEKHR